MRRRSCRILCIVALCALVPVPPVRADAAPLALAVTTAGVVTVADAQLVAAGWTVPLPRERVTLLHHGQMLPLTDTATGFAFLALPNAAPWSRESVYWLTLSPGAAPRAALPTRLPTPLTWEPDGVYDRHQATARGDSWWADELRGSHTVQATLVLPEAVQAGTVLAVQMRATHPGSHAVEVSVDGDALGVLRWRDPPDGAQVVTPTIALPAHAAGVLRIDLALVTSAETILVDAISLPTVLPPALPLASSPLRHATALPIVPLDTDLLVLTPDAFRSALPPLVAAHAARDQRAVVVDVQAVYDAFSFGERDPAAIRALIRQTRPRAVLLVGAGTVALRQAAPARPTLIPPYLVRLAHDGETACDTCYTRLDEGDVLAHSMPAVPIGRLPVTTLAEAQAVVAKTVVALGAPPAGGWRGRVLALADNDVEADGTHDPAGSFPATLEAGLALLPRGMAVTRLYYAPHLRAPDGAFEPDTARLRCRLFRALDGGSSSDLACPPGDAMPSGVALWMYAGHGSPWQWAATSPDAPTPYLWYLYDADARRNGDRLPILLAMTCLSGDFANPVLETTDERLVRWASGGVVASLSASGEGVNGGHARLLRGVLAQLVAATGERTLGAAHLAGLRALAGVAPEVAFTFTVLGDPLVALPFVPQYAVALPLVEGR